MSDRPLASLVLVTYKQEAFIREAVQSALNQTYHPLEIVISDDASPDKTFEIISEELRSYNGRHQVVVNRNRQNLGLVGNLNGAVKLSTGELLIVQAGDDISVPHRVSRLMDKWIKENRRPDLVYSDVLRIKEDGSPLAAPVSASAPNTMDVTVEKMVKGEWFIAGGMAAAYTQRLFERFGPVHPDVQYEDYVLTFRAMLGGGYAYVNEPLVHYRVHDSSILQAAKQVRGTRQGAAKRGKHAVAEQMERLRAWDLCGKQDPQIRWKLERNLNAALLDAESSSGNRLRSFKCVILALVSLRPRSAWAFLQRDVLRREGRWEGF